MRFTLVPPVQVQPEVTLSNWIIVQSKKFRHLAGYCIESATVRYTTPICILDTSTLTCQTRSGRHYQLLPPHAEGEAALDLLTSFKELNGPEAWDVTNEVLNDPDYRYLSLSAFDAKTGELYVALPWLKLLAANPSPWLNQISKALARCDIDPALHGKALNLSDSDWQQWQRGELGTVPLGVALRGRLLYENLSMLLTVASSESHLVSCLNNAKPLERFNGKSILLILTSGNIDDLMELHTFLAGGIFDAPFL